VTGTNTCTVVFNSNISTI